MSRVDWGWVLAVTVICWLFAVCALLGIRRGGRALTRYTRTHLRRSKGAARMTDPTSTRRGEHTPRPGANWQTTLVRTEQVIPDDAPDPRPNRATRRALARARRKK